MNLSFRSTDYSSVPDCEFIARCLNEPELRTLWLPRRSEEHERPLATAESVQAAHAEPSDFHSLHDLIFLLEGEPIGITTLYLNPPHRLSKGENVAWPTIVIADAGLRRKGIGTRVGAHILELAREAGATHIEAGVFEFNHAIRALLEKSGFRCIGEVPHFTCHEGRTWPDVRYLLDLNQNSF